MQDIAPNSCSTQEKMKFYQQLKRGRYAEAHLRGCMGASPGRAADAPSQQQALPAAAKASVSLCERSG